MGRAKKIVLIAAGLLVVLVLAAAVFVKVYFTKDRIMALVIPPMEARLHRRVTLEDAGAGLAGFHLEGLTIQGEKEPSPLLRVESARLGWDLFALFRGKVALSEVTLRSPRIALFRDSKGRLSIDDILAPEEKEEKGEPEEAPGPSGGVPFSVSINRVALQKGEVAFTDRAKAPAKTYLLSEIELTADNFSLTDPFGYRFSAAATVGKPFSISAEGTADLAEKDIASHLEVARVMVAPALKELTGSPPQVSAGELNLDCDAKLSGFKKLGLTAHAKALGLRLATANGPAGPFELSFDLDAALGLPVEEVAVKGLGIEINGQKIEGRGKFVKGNSPHRVELKLTSEELDLDEIMALFPQKEKPGEGKGAEPAAAEKKAAKKPVVIKPPPVRGKVSLRVARLKVKNVVVSPFEALAVMGDGGVDLEPIKGGLYGGTFAGKAAAAFGSPGPPFTKEIRVKGVSLDPLVSALKPDLKGQIHGNLDLSGNAGGRGADLKKLRSNLDLLVTDGKIKDHPAVERIARLFKTGELEMIVFDELKAEVSTAFGVATLKRLTMTGPHIRLSGYAAAGLIDKKLKGKLTVKVPRRWAKNLIRSDAVLDEISDAEGWPAVPVLVYGTTEDPKFNVDPEWLAKKTVGAVGKGVKKVIEDGGTGAKDLGKGIEKGLKKGIEDLKEGLPFFR